jgi:hypothetical protein
LDGFPYEKNELLEWIKIVGVPHVLHLDVEINELITRMRKKDEADLAQEIS